MRGNETGSVFLFFVYNFIVVWYAIIKRGGCRPIKLKTEQHEPHLKSGVNSGVPEGQAVPAQQ